MYLYRSTIGCCFMLRLVMCFTCTSTRTYKSVCTLMQWLTVQSVYREVPVQPCIVIRHTWVLVLNFGISSRVVLELDLFSYSCVGGYILIPGLIEFAVRCRGMHQYAYFEVHLYF